MCESFFELVVLEKESWLFDALNLENKVLLYIEFFVLFEEIRGDLVLHFTERSVQRREFLIFRTANFFHLIIKNTRQFDRSAKGRKFDQSTILWIYLAFVQPRISLAKIVKMG